MLDLRTVLVRDVVPVREISLIDRDPPKVRLTGEDFLNAYLVVVNGLAVDDFVVVSKSVIEFVLPEELWEPPHRLRTVDVFSETFTSTPTSFLEPYLGKMPQQTTGLHKLVQQFVKVLMTRPGTNAFNLKEGGGILTLVGTLTDEKNVRNVIARVMLAVKNTTKMIRSSRTNLRLPASERLKEVRVVDVRPDPRTTGINVRLILESEDGTPALANIGLSAVPEPME